VKLLGKGKAEELMGIIEAKGREISEALAALRGIG